MFGKQLHPNFKEREKSNKFYIKTKDLLDKAEQLHRVTINIEELMKKNPESFSDKFRADFTVWKAQIISSLAAAKYGHMMVTAALGIGNFSDAFTVGNLLEGALEALEEPIKTAMFDEEMAKHQQNEE